MGKGRDNRRDERNGFGEWGDYFEAKKAKLCEQFEERTVGNVKKESDIFKSVAIFVNGLTNPNADELKQLMAIHGGTYHTYQHSSTSHIIASNLPNVKINKLGSVPIVKPSWITDSISLGKLLDYKRYLLYTNQSVSQPKLDFAAVVPSKAPPPPTTKTASDPKFLEEFYQNSRLHLISTLRDEFKQLVCELRENKKDKLFPGREKLSNLKKSNEKMLLLNDQPIIMHIDMDCFFVSVGLKTHPELKGQPVAVTHARNAQLSVARKQDTMSNVEFPSGPADLLDEVNLKASMSEIASCSYEARKFGVKNGMFLGHAIKLCPNLKTIPYDFDGYRQVSHTLYNTVASYTLDIEAVSCDEMYVDVKEVLKQSAISVDQFAQHLRDEIMTITGCPCSTGFGANRLQARLATKRAKPCGQFYLQANDVESYFAKIPVSELPGVGYSTLAKLKILGLKNCGDIQLFNLDILKRELGPKNGETIKDMSYGIDRKPLNYNYERKSVSAEINYGIRFKTIEECYNFFKRLSNEVFSRLNDTKMRAKCVTLKLMVRATDAPIETAKYLGHGICDGINKSVSLTNPIQDAETIYTQVKNLFSKLNVDFNDLRGIGIHLSKLEKAPQINKALQNFLKQPSTNTTSNQEKSQMENKGKSKANNKHKGTLNDFFKVARFSSSQEQQKFHSNKISNIDLEVLKLLPEDIKSEIIKEYNLNINDNEIKPHTQKNNEMDEDKVNETQYFYDMDWFEMKIMIMEWIENEREPKQTDVTMLAKYLKKMAIERQIEQLKFAFNFLHRKMSLLNCEWHKAYFSIVSMAQEGMIARFGGTLLVNKIFKCCRQQ